MKKKTLLIVFAFLTCTIYSQNIKTLEKMDDSYQNCLDAGINMHECSVKYYIKADSLLNVVYKKIRLNLNLSKKEALKKEQLLWLKKRDKFFIVANKSISQDVGSNVNEEFIMKYNDKKYLFVYDRIEELLKKYKL